MLMYGFGYNPSKDDYLIVVGSYDPIISELVSTSIDLEIFSLRANKWKQIDSYLPYNDDTFGGDFKVGLFSSGALHWPLYNHATRRNVIVAFDLKEMTISDIALPHDFSCSNSPKYDLLIFRELISVWIEEKGKIDIWVMQEYAVQSSWTKTLALSLDSSPYFSPVCFTDCGHIVGIDRRRRELVKFNDKGQLLEEQSHRNCCFQRSQMVVYTESLLSLPSGTEQSQEDG
ncbi:F-box protein CPR1-like [Vicia villosa]|uniref:F-box protein CPR1-like n=1 Tax=Vicia villosa TaxID=3911 RepID=UPI00273B5FEC|nr:F-box protein CPR1-like [Vicia villosa]